VVRLNCEDDNKTQATSTYLLGKQFLSIVLVRTIYRSCKLGFFGRLVQVQEVLSPLISNNMVGSSDFSETSRQHTSVERCNRGRK
jgi:hypothetical protein